MHKGDFMNYKITNLNLEGKIFVDKKGTLIQCLTRSELKNNGSYIAFGTIYGGSIIKGQIRGGHFHEFKEEYFILLRGTVKFYLEDVNTKEKKKGDLSMGYRLRIGENVAHAMTNVKDDPAIFFSVATKPYEEGPDTHKYDMVLEDKVL